MYQRDSHCSDFREIWHLSINYRLLKNRTTMSKTLHKDHKYLRFIVAGNTYKFAIKSFMQSICFYCLQWHVPQQYTQKTLLRFHATVVMQTCYNVTLCAHCVLLLTYVAVLMSQINRIPIIFNCWTWSDVMNAVAPTQIGGGGGYYNWRPRNGLWRSEMDWSGSEHGPLAVYSN
jgi:hypothetical protein